MNTKKKMAIIGIIITAVFLVLGFVIGGIFSCNKKENKELPDITEIEYLEFRNNRDGTMTVDLLMDNAERKEITSVVIPDKVDIEGISTEVKGISSGAFANCTALADIKLPKGLKTIGQGAFSGCVSLTSILIPVSVTSIEKDAFKDCYNLKNIYYYATNCSSGDGVFYNAGIYVDGIDLIIGDNVESIPGIFLNSYIKTLTIGNKVTSIPNSAFKDCVSLESVTIGNRVTSIGGSAFEGCSSLTEIEIPSSVTYIGNYAFRNCSSLTSVTFENTSGWYMKEWSGEWSIDVINPEINATNLTLNYSHYYWERV